MTQFTVRTNQKEVSAPLEVWFTALLNTMTSDDRNRLIEMVARMQGESYTLLNPNGSLTTVMKANPGRLNLVGNNLGD